MITHICTYIHAYNYNELNNKIKYSVVKRFTFLCFIVGMACIIGEKDLPFHTNNRHL